MEGEGEGWGGALHPGLHPTPPAPSTHHPPSATLPPSPAISAPPSHLSSHIPVPGTPCYTTRCTRRSTSLLHYHVPLYPPIILPPKIAYRLPVP